MPRISIPLPKSIVFETNIQVRVTDINYGAHLANQNYLAYAHEARVQWLASMGYSELDVEGMGIILTDAAVVFKKQCYLNDRLSIFIGIDDINKYGFDILYIIKKQDSDIEVARIKTGVVFFDYRLQKITNIPDLFKNKNL